MRPWLISWTYVMTFLAGVHCSEWSARTDHAAAKAAGRWLRSWFV